MAWQNFATKTSPTAMSTLDTQSNNVAQWGAIDCSTSGTNAITLTASLSGYTPAAVANYVTYRFVAANTTTGATTLKISNGSFLNCYAGDGTTQITTGDIVQNQAYLATYNSALNSAAGGWLITPLGAIGYQTTGTGLIVRQTSPTLITPALGTPGSGTLTNCTGYPVSTISTYTTLSGTSTQITGLSASGRTFVVSFVGASFNATAALRIRIGPSGGVATSGYGGVVSICADASTPSNVIASSGWDAPSVGAALAYSGNLHFALADAATHTYTLCGILADIGGATSNIYTYGGSIALSGALDRVQITTVAATATFDAGSMSILTI